MRKEQDIDITKGIKNNKLMYVLQSKGVGRIFVPPSIPEHLLPYLELVDKKWNKP